MARSVETIAGNINSDLKADPVLSQKITTTSMTGIFRLFGQIWSRVANLQEQIWDNYKATLKDFAAKSPAANLVWIQHQVFMYQYDPSGISGANNLTILPGGKMGYTTVDPTFNIVTRCAVDVSPDHTVNVRVAQGTPGNNTPITGSAFTQLDDYLTNVLYAGMNHNLISLVPDKVYLEGTVYYKPGFTYTIQSIVETALSNYLDRISSKVQTATDLEYFEGRIKVSDIIRVIKSLNAVDDVDLKIVRCRADATAFSSGSVIYDVDNGIDNRFALLAAGYAVQENTPGYTWADKLKYKSA